MKWVILRKCNSTVLRVTSSKKFAMAAASGGRYRVVAEVIYNSGRKT